MSDNYSREELEAMSRNDLVELADSYDIWKIDPAVMPPEALIETILAQQQTDDEINTLWDMWESK